MPDHALIGGFSDPAPQAATAFRAILDAMARPGRIHTTAGAMPPAPLSHAAGAVLLTLCDADTPLHLAGAADTKACRDWVRFHLGAPLTARTSALFAIGTWDDLMPLGGYLIGTPEYPDRSATLIVDGTDFDAPSATLRGPGIKETARLPLPDLAPIQANHRHFPLGVDFIFTGGARLAALPRTTEVF